VLLKISSEFEEAAFEWIAVLAFLLWRHDDTCPRNPAKPQLGVPFCGTVPF